MKTKTEQSKFIQESCKAMEAYIKKKQKEQEESKRAIVDIARARYGSGVDK